jgi:hypothetical protein
MPDARAPQSAASHLDRLGAGEIDLAQAKALESSSFLKKRTKKLLPV